MQQLWLVDAIECLHFGMAPSWNMSHGICFTVGWTSERWHAESWKVSDIGESEISVAMKGVFIDVSRFFIIFHTLPFYQSLIPSLKVSHLIVIIRNLVVIVLQVQFFSLLHRIHRIPRNGIFVSILKSSHIIYEWTTFCHLTSFTFIHSKFFSGDNWGDFGLFSMQWQISTSRQKTTTPPNRYSTRLHLPGENGEPGVEITLERFWVQHLASLFSF